ncbi:MAG: alpha-hydroxy-acid oxidizing protein [Solirubrobacterales bacterium]|nr:alpha-hydroxy-acid oxidizing protein [Solirubrobacterales bacterium]
MRRQHAEARARLPEPAYDYFAGGAGDEVTLAENEQAWQHVWLRPRQLLGLGAADASLELLGAAMAAPIVLAPVATHGLLHPDGELAVARAAADAGLVMCLSTRATTDLADVAAATTAAKWFQLYMDIDRDRVRRILERVQAHGYGQIVMTIDLPVAGRRERERRHGPVPFPEGVALATHLGDQADGGVKPVVGGWHAPTWEDVAWVAQASGVPVMLKGGLTAEDALLAEQAGASAVVVSNHGARQLDGVVPTAVALPEVAAALAGRLPVLVDGGIRSGVDVVRALALGADATLVGRPYLWALAAGGREGVSEALAALVEDTERTLALVGAERPADVRREHVRLRAW